MIDIAERMADNVARIRERIAAAARRSGRPAADVTLVAVTKYVGPDEVRALLASGCRDIGESRPQELWRKADALPDEHIVWHLVGHLQRNKVRRTLPLISLLHSTDSPRLLRAVNESSRELRIKSRVLLEVNISGDLSKHGLAPSQLAPLLPELAEMSHIQVNGLMAMASLSGGVDQVRKDFAGLRQLRDTLWKDCPPEVKLNELSMGMSGDFEVAIEEGATIVRLGSALFEGLPNVD